MAAEALGRFVIASIVFGVATVLPLAADSVAVLSPLVFLTGLSIAPVLITGMSLVERLVPRRALTEGLSWSTTALTVGVTVGAAVAGPMVDAYGASVAFRFSAASAVLTAVVALAVYPWLRAAPSADELEDESWAAPDCPMPGASTAETSELSRRGKMDP